MKIVLAFLLCITTSAFAQLRIAAVELPKQAACLECGVVGSVRAITKEVKPAPVDATRPSGLVATVPFGKNAEKPRIGSSTKLGRESVKSDTRWEVLVRMDDGRTHIVMDDDEPDLREGDKVRVEEGRVVRRED